MALLDFHIEDLDPLPDAACAGLSPEVDLLNGHTARKWAKVLCPNCPVRAGCREVYEGLKAALDGDVIGLYDGTFYSIGHPDGVKYA